MDAVSDFRNYQSASRSALIGRLCGVTSELANAHLIWAASVQGEKSARIQGFMRSQETTVTGRERDAEAQSLALALGVVELLGSIRALVEERDLLRFLLGETNAGSGGELGSTQGL